MISSSDDLGGTSLLVDGHRSVSELDLKTQLEMILAVAPFKHILYLDVMNRWKHLRPT